MQDKRVVVFEEALEDLVDSLDATLRLAGWDAAETVPEPLKDSASRLMARLGAADRLSAGIFKGKVADTARVKSMTASMRKLESAYVVYLRSVKLSPESGEKATRDLVTTLEEVRAQSLAAD